MKHLIAILLFFLSSPLISQENIENDSLFINEFLQTYKEEGISKSLDFLYSSSDWIINENSEDIQNLKAQLIQITTHIGKLNGFKIIKEINLKNHLRAYSILLLYDRQPLRFIIVLYKPKNSWQLQTFQFDTDVSDELINSMNLSWEF
ncbi:MAG: hypothetical protein C0599_13500 [Salinivirgaceae bacterium]|nr:MAG: hypothetical protein C0599_13500 [Salinivirgaceae bacterium]